MQHRAIRWLRFWFPIRVLLWLVFGVLLSGGGGGVAVSRRPSLSLGSPRGRTGSLRLKTGHFLPVEGYPSVFPGTEEVSAANADDDSVLVGPPRWWLPTEVIACCTSCGRFLYASYGLQLFPLDQGCGRTLGCVVMLSRKLLRMTF